MKTILQELKEILTPMGDPTNGWKEYIHLNQGYGNICTEICQFAEQTQLISQHFFVKRFI